MVIFTHHALLKLKQRGIKKDSVTQTLHKPDHVSPSHNQRSIVFKKIGSMYLKVVFRKEEEDIVVITQHWVKKI